MRRDSLAMHLEAWRIEASGAGASSVDKQRQTWGVRTPGWGGAGAAVREGALPLLPFRTSVLPTWPCLPRPPR